MNPVLLDFYLWQLCRHTLWGLGLQKLRCPVGTKECVANKELGILVALRTGTWVPQGY